MRIVWFIAWFGLSITSLTTCDSGMPRVQGVSFGASERLVVSPGKEGSGYFQMPGGPVDHPLSPFYGAGHEAWAKGERRPLLPGETQHTLRLAPAGSN